MSEQSRESKLKEAQAEQYALAKAYYEMSLTPNGRTVIDDLLARTSNRPVVRRGADGMVDASATMAGAGMQEIGLYINEMLTLGSNRPKAVAHG